MANGSEFEERNSAACSNIRHSVLGLKIGSLSQGVDADNDNNYDDNDNPRQ